MSENKDNKISLKTDQVSLKEIEKAIKEEEKKEKKEQKAHKKNTVTENLNDDTSSVDVKVVNENFWDKEKPEEIEEMISEDETVQETISLPLEQVKQAEESAVTKEISAEEIKEEEKKTITKKAPNTTKKTTSKTSTRKTKKKKKKKHPLIKFILLLLVFAITIAGTYFFVLDYVYEPTEKDYQELDVTKNRTWYLSSSTADEPEYFSVISWDIKGLTYNSTGNSYNKENLVQYNGAILQDFIKEKEANFYLFQSVDVASTRSAKIDETALIDEVASWYSKIYCQNYHTLYKFWPLTDPVGIMYSGLYTLSNYHVGGSVMRIVPHEETIPAKYFAKDTCGSVADLPVSRGIGDVWIINIDLSDCKSQETYDKELETVFSFMEEAYGMGYYCIVGGNFQADFQDDLGINNSVSGTEPVLKSSALPEHIEMVVPDNISSASTYKLDQTGNVTYHVQDGYLITDNIEATATILNLGFANSDHNPVELSFRLKTRAEYEEEHPETVEQEEEESSTEEGSNNN